MNLMRVKVQKSKVKVITQNLKVLTFTLLLCTLSFTLYAPLAYAQDPITCTDKDGNDHAVGETWLHKCLDFSGDATMATCNTDGSVFYEDKYDNSHRECGSTATNPDIRTGTGEDATKIFGSIKTPDFLKPFVGSDNGASGISKFLNSLIILIFSAAGILFIFMLLWGAFDIVMSGGEKEKVADARKRITYAFIGIILFAIAFAVISLFGEFTGFNFFTEKADARCADRGREEYYYDANVDSCIHTYRINYPQCTIRYDHVNPSLCGRR